MEYLLILKAHHEICGEEIGLITNQSGFLGIEVKEEVVDSIDTLKAIFEKYKLEAIKFDYVYLCTHGDSNGFDIEMGNKFEMSWAKFGEIICQSDLLNDNTIFLLACCRGGIFKVAMDMFAVCNSINYVCGAKWKLRSADLATGFVVFLYNLKFKKAEPSYAAQKATLATDYTFTCHDRAEIESSPHYENRQRQLFLELGWINEEGQTIIEDETIKENAGLS